MVHAENISNFDFNGRNYEIITELLEIGNKLLKLIIKFFGLFGLAVFLIITIPVYFLIFHPIGTIVYRGSAKQLAKYKDKVLKLLNDPDFVSKMNQDEKLSLYKLYRFIKQERIRTEKLITWDLKNQPKIAVPIANMILRLVTVQIEFEKALSEKLFDRIPEIRKEDNLPYPINDFSNFSEDWDDESMDIYDVKYGPLSNVN